MKQEILDRLQTLPEEPGVYLMKNAQGEVIYVGKAVNLRHRVRSYFRNGGDGRAFIPFLDTLLNALEVIVVRTEQEALILESELIKRYRPKFNVLLKDDKSFICLKIDLAMTWPRLEVVRAVQMQRSGGRREEMAIQLEDGLQGTLNLSGGSDHRIEMRESVSRRLGNSAGEMARSTQSLGRRKIRLFGPYSSTTSIRETIRFVERQFCLRTCTDRQIELHAAQGRACLQYQMHRCSGPCIGAVSREEYSQLVRDAVQFLEGKSAQLVEELESRMREAALSLEFEKAASLRDRLKAISRSLERQRIVSEERVDRDVIGISSEGGRRVIYLLFIRYGRLIGGHAFTDQDTGFPPEETIAAFLRAYYAGEVVLPEEVLLPVELPEGEGEAVERWLTEKKGGKVSLKTPKRGAKADLIAMALRNARESLVAASSSKEGMKSVLTNLQKKLRLTRLPRRIECYDISLFQGDCAVGSGVCFVDGMPHKAGYRRYRIKSVTGTDDFAMLFEVLRRRVAHGDLPDLFLIDGGKGQLASAAAAFRDAGVVPGCDFDLASLAKSRLLESDDLGESRSNERIFLLDTKDPVVLDQRSEELFVLTRLRDEAHRFAITYHRLTRSKRALTSDVNQLPGVGKVRRAKLLKHFGSMKRLKAATEEQLAAVSGIGPALAKTIRSALDELEASDAPKNDGNHHVGGEDASPERFIWGDAGENP